MSGQSNGSSANTHQNETNQQPGTSTSTQISLPQAPTLENNSYHQLDKKALQLPMELQHFLDGKKFVVNVRKPDVSEQVLHDESKYVMPPKGKGYAFILNIIEFRGHPRREGAYLDTANMTKLWEELGFKVFPENEDYRVSDIKCSKAIKKELNIFKERCIRDKVDCIVFFVGSHGYNDMIQTSDGAMLDVYSDIIYEFQFSSNKIKNGKEEEKRVAKIFINQSCQTDLPPGLSTGSSVPKKTLIVSDTIYIKAQTPKRLANRHVKRGSYFVTIFIHVLMTKAWNTSLVKMLDEVQFLLSEATKCKENIQLPPITTMGLADPLYFFTGFQAVSKVAPLQQYRQGGVRFDVLPPVRHFTGRADELANLHRKLKQQDVTDENGMPKTAAILGLGGIGKTQLARGYIKEYASEYEGNVIWISAETEESIAEGFRRLATDYLQISSLNVDRKEKAISSVVNAVYNHFQNKLCLFVFDNVESISVLQKFLPLHYYNSNPNPPSILITSRDQEWKFDAEAEVLHLQEMLEKDAVEFIKTALKIIENNQDKVIVQLVYELQGFPLALSQAISYILQRQTLSAFTVRNYLVKFQSCSQRLLDFPSSATGLNTYTKTTLNTWIVTTERIAATKGHGKKAISLLNMISYFQPDKIPIQLLSKKFHKKAIVLLEKYSLISTDPNEETISIHRLVQEVTRITLKRSKSEETTLGAALELFIKNGWPVYSELHVINVFVYCRQYRRLVVHFKTLPRIIVFSTNEMFAPSFVIELKEVLCKYVPSDDVDVVKLDLYMMLFYDRVGNFENSLNISEKILPVFLKNDNDVFKPEEIYVVQNSLARAYEKVGKHSESYKVYCQVFEYLSLLKGLDCWETVDVIIHIGKYIPILGHPYALDALPAEVPLLINAENKEIFIETLQTFYVNKKYLIGADACYTSVMADIGSFLFYIGEATSAETILSNVYEQTKKMIVFEQTENCLEQDNHRCDRFSRETAISSLFLLGQLDIGEGIREEAVTTFYKLYSIKTNCGIMGLGYRIRFVDYLHKLGQHNTALAAYRHILEQLQNDYPNHHEEIFLCQHGIAMSLFQLERYDESLAWFIGFKEKILKRHDSRKAADLANVDREINRIRLVMTLKKQLGGDSDKEVG